MRRAAWRIAALILALAVLLGGCSFSLSVQEDADMVSFDRMEYVRPDLEAMQTLFDRTRSLAEAAGEEDADELNGLLEQCWQSYEDFYTMQTLAMLRSDADLTDEEYADEYTFCWNSAVQVEQWLDQTLTACAASRARVSSNLLAGYDGSGGSYYSDRAIELMEQENRLLDEYWQVMSVEEIELDGEMVHFFDYIDSPDVSRQDYERAELAYYQTCNALAAPVYIELIRTRRALAEELGYDSYEQMQYDAYGRGYTPQQAGDYLEQIARTIAPYYTALMADNPYSRVSYDSLSRSALLWQLGQATQQMAPVVAEAFSFMEEYKLYNVETSYDKAAGSYTTYLDSYSAPFCFLDAYGDVEDLLDLAHEFGHFADAYCNYNATMDLDLAETYSQAMANLVLCRAREFLDVQSYENLRLLHMLSTLSVYTEQASYAAFEAAAYALPEEELTVERLNALALECDVRFGVAEVSGEQISAVYWTQVNHLFESPFYVISYCVSADAAMQILELELREPGAGSACYADLLDWHEDALLPELERVGLESPFAGDRTAQTLRLIESALDGGAAHLEAA